MSARRYDTRVRARVGALRREIAVWLAALAIFFNVLAEGSLRAGPIEIEPALAGVAGETLVICTAAGRLVADRDGRPASQPGGHDGHDGPHCVFCLPLMQGSLLAPSAAGQDFARRAPLPIRRQIAELRAPTVRRASHAWARGPPLA